MDLLKEKKFSPDSEVISNSKKRQAPKAVGESGGNGESNVEQKVNQFRDWEGITTANLNRGLWWVENREKIKKIIILVLLIISIVTWSLFVGTFGYYLIFGIKQDRIMLQELTQGPSINHAAVMAMAAQNLSFANVQSLKVKDGRYDFMVQVANPNQKFYADFDYYFNVDGRAVGQRQGFILPGETKYFFVEGVDLASPPDAVEFRTNNLAWHRINARFFPDWGEYAKERLDITTDNKQFLPAHATVLSEKEDLNELDFTLHNNTIFNYWQVNLKIILSSYGNIVGISEYTANNLMTGESRNISMTIPGSIGHVDDIEIIPELDITKSDIYINYGEGAAK